MLSSAWRRYAFVAGACVAACLCSRPAIANAPPSYYFTNTVPVPRGWAAAFDWFNCSRQPPASYPLLAPVDCTLFPSARVSY
jgi:hypothetical protein